MFGPKFGLETKGATVEVEGSMLITWGLSLLPAAGFSSMWSKVWCGFWQSNIAFLSSFNSSKCYLAVSWNHLSSLPEPSVRLGLLATLYIAIYNVGTSISGSLTERDPVVAAGVTALSNA